MHNSPMRLSVCIPTMNRTQELKACLEAVWNSSVKPDAVIVSDDSPDVGVQQLNRQVVDQFPGTHYLEGPHAGVCANRNNAVNAIATTDTDFVAFIDDDICIEPDFVEQAIQHYTALSPEQQKYTILTGISRDSEGNESIPVKLSFRGYFCPAETPEAVDLHSAVFPRSLFTTEQWDEQIFFGYEDAELCLRALKRGYHIQYCPALRVQDTCAGKSVLAASKTGTLTKSQIYVNAARLYVGIKRYKYLFPDHLKLTAFLGIYFLHITVFLARKRMLHLLPDIIQQSNGWKLLLSPTSTS